MIHDVYVPLPGTHLHATVAPKSGIVGRPYDHQPGKLLVDFEGAVHGQSNIVTFADRVMHAASRQEASYPTIARMVVDQADVVLVGRFDPDERTVELLPDRALLCAWLGVDAPSLADEVRESRPRFVTPAEARRRLRGRS